VLLGLEQVRVVPGLMAANPLDFVSYPISHSLLMAVVWGALIGGVYHVRRRDRRGAGLWAMIVLLVLIFASGFGSAAPASQQVIGLTALGLWLFVPWAAWVDRHRQPVSA
jgi:membrane-bound metal-dependent hydrolase YbcI (DUF457 family)